MTFLIAWKNLLKASELRASVRAYKIFLKGGCMHGAITSDCMQFHLLQIVYVCRRGRLHVKEELQLSASR